MHRPGREASHDPIRTTYSRLLRDRLGRRGVPRDDLDGHRRALGASSTDDLAPWIDGSTNTRADCDRPGRDLFGLDARRKLCVLDRLSDRQDADDDRLLWRGTDLPGAEWNLLGLARRLARGPTQHRRVLPLGTPRRIRTPLVLQPLARFQRRPGQRGFQPSGSLRKADSSSRCAAVK